MKTQLFYGLVFLLLLSGCTNDESRDFNVVINHTAYEVSAHMYLKKNEGVYTGGYEDFLSVRSKIEDECSLGHYMTNSEVSECIRNVINEDDNVVPEKTYVVVAHERYSRSDDDDSSVSGGAAALLAVH